MLIKINCNKIEMPVTFTIKPETANLQIKVVFNDDNCDLGQKQRSNNFIIMSDTSESIENLIIKIIAFTQQEFTIETEFSMRNEFIRYDRARRD